jgi:hypothetical protein
MLIGLMVLEDAVAHRELQRAAGNAISAPGTAFVRTAGASDDE